MPVILATLCYVRSDEYTLMLHRTSRQGDMHFGKWNGLGGKLERGETPEECVVREVWEESGLRIERPEFHGMLVFPRFNGDQDWHVYLFVARNFAGELIESPEGRLAWVPNNELQELDLWEGDRHFLQWLDRYQFFSGKFDYEEGALRSFEVVFYAGTQTVEIARENVLESPDRDQVDFVPAYDPSDDTFCWVCGGEVAKRHCKIVCLTCGFLRDCGDP